MTVKFRREARIVNIFEPRAEYCARCSRITRCPGALIIIEYRGIRSEVCASHIPRGELEKAWRLGEPVFFDSTGRIALKNFEDN